MAELSGGDVVLTWRCGPSRPIAASGFDIENVTTGETRSVTGEPSYTWAALPVPDTYDFRVRSTNAFASSEWSEPISITVSRAGAPNAGDDVVATEEDVAVSVDVLANDFADGGLDPSSLRIVTAARGRAMRLWWVELIQYVPRGDFFGSDSFTYEVCDLEGQCSTATVTVEVAAVADAPIAVDEMVSTDEDVPVDIDVLANDIDVDDDLDPSTVSLVDDPSFGSALVEPDGSVTYTPDAEPQRNRLVRL